MCFLIAVVSSTASDSSTKGEAIPSIQAAADWTRNLLKCGQIEQAKEDRNDEKKANTLVIISANVHSLRPRSELITMWGADVVAMQETKLAPHAIAEAATILRETDGRLPTGNLADPKR